MTCPELAEGCIVMKYSTPAVLTPTSTQSKINLTQRSQNARKKEEWCSGYE